VVRYARGCARVLTARGVKALVIACNTVSAVALDILRAELDLPVIGVIEPGASAAVAAAQREVERLRAPVKIGVLGTQGTIASGAYPRAVARISTRFEVVGRAAPLLVPLAEEGWLDGQVPELAVERYLEPLLGAGAGVVVLGCTHYPLFAGMIRQVAERLAGRPIPVVDSAHATAERVAKHIAEHRIRPAPPSAGDERLENLVTDRPASFAEVVSRFLGAAAPEVTQIDL
jgi:glutamate racemase